MGIAEIGGVIIAQAAQRVEFAAQNMANMTTAGYKARHLFQGLVDVRPIESATGQIPAEAVGVDFSPGKLSATGQPADLAIAGNGFFVVRIDDGLFYTRSGQFLRNADGRMVTVQGAVLQAQNGDLELGRGDFSVLPDGMVQQDGQPVAQIKIANFQDTAVLKPASAGLFSAPSGTEQEADGAQIRQGMLETSNVVTADEMVSVMAALRSAETGQRLVQIYDDLMGRAVTTFGQN